MVLLNTKILHESQHQGRIFFYIPNIRKEATQIGSVAGISPEDLIYAQYRKVGVLVWHEFTVYEFVNQCFGNSGDKSKKRQMAVHYGSKKLNFDTLSSLLGTQLLQAAGRRCVRLQVTIGLRPLCYQPLW